MENLWGNLSDVDEFKVAKSILDEQALYVAKMTKNVLYAEAVVDNSYKDELLNPQAKSFYYKLVIRSEYLNHYEFKVLTIKHDLIQYPLEILLPKEIGEDLSGILDVKDKLTHTAESEYCFIASNEEEFLFYLAYILKTKSLMQIIKALYKMSDF